MILVAVSRRQAARWGEFWLGLIFLRFQWVGWGLGGLGWGLGLCGLFSRRAANLPRNFWDHAIVCLRCHDGHRGRGRVVWSNPAQSLTNCQHLNFCWFAQPAFQNLNIFCAFWWSEILGFVSSSGALLWRVFSARLGQHVRICWRFWQGEIFGSVRGSRRVKNCGRFQVCKTPQVFPLPLAIMVWSPGQTVRKACDQLHPC